mmetsp:Transcript_46878/g.73379  ORF Transcript_46878/g.73379 Transcript_46878/m.73379 type:complete len:91 (-) Transcript_46878:310-582(-)
MSAAKAEAVQLYRNLIRYSKKFQHYNFREYFLRRTREEFAANKGESDPAKVSELLERGKRELEVIRRQAMMSELFAPNKKFVVEQMAKQE